MRSSSRILIVAMVSVSVAGMHKVLADAASSEQQRTVAVLEQAVKTDPANSELWVHLGFAYRKMNQMDQSQTAFEKARAINPRDTDALYMLGLTYESKHQTQEALKAWNDYLAITTDTAKRGVAEKHIHQLNP